MMVSPVQTQKSVQFISIHNGSRVECHAILCTDDADTEAEEHTVHVMCGNG